MTKDPSLSSCCSARLYLDPLICQPQHCTFAKVPRCSSCHGYRGAVKILYGSPKEIAAAFTGTSEALMTSHYSGPRLRSPLHFKMAAGVLVPEGMPAQSELPSDEVPF